MDKQPHSSSFRKLRQLSGMGGSSADPDGSPKRLPLYPAFILVLVTVLVVWGLSELVGRAWLSGAGPDAVRVFQIARDLAASLAAALLMGWYLVRDRPSLFPPVVGEETGPETLPRPSVDPIRHHIRWFIRMRWIACLVATLLTFTIVKVLHLLDEHVFAPLLLCVALLVVANFAFDRLLEHGRFIRHLVEIQVYTDLAALTALFHFSGGIENPLTTLPIFHVIISGILLAPRQCYAIAGVASLLFGLLAFAEWGGWINHYTLLIFPHGDHVDVHAAHETSYVVSRSLLQTAILFLTAYFITTIIERLRAEERHALAMSARALEERQMLERVVEATAVGLLVLDSELRPVWINEQLRTWLEALAAPDADPSNALRSRVAGKNEFAAATLEDGRTRVSELETALAGNVVRHFQVTTAPVLADDGHIRQVVELVQDVTEQKKAQVHLVQTSKMAALGELAGSVAHEVNNPVAIISAKARLLLSDHTRGMSEKVGSDLHRIVDLSDRVGRIAQGLLSFCRPSPGTKIPVDIRVPLKKSLALIDHSVAKNGIRLEESLPPTLPPVRANSNELEQVFLNLLVNAIDAMEDGGTLSVSVGRDDNSVIGASAVAISIRDSGRGIPAEIQSRIFEPFFTTKEEGRGTGLGLSICDGLIRSHGGAIDVESDPGRGTNFVVRLPVTEERDRGNDE